MSSGEILKTTIFKFNRFLNIDFDVGDSYFYYTFLYSFAVYQVFSFIGKVFIFRMQ